MHASPPKYDPITGELVLPMPIRPDQALDTPVSQIPVAVPVLGYASGRTQSGMEDVVRNPFVALFSPPNLFVMFVIFVMHPAGTMLTIAAIGMMGMIGMKLLAVLMFVVIVAHYGMVLEEMAIEARNDLPRPLRDLQLYEDVFLPFCHVVVAMVVCYWPLIVLLAVGGPAYPLVLADLALLLLGSFFFPAVLLTAVTSGTLLNLWPPRVLAVISCIGLRYLLHVVFFMAAALVYLLGVAGTCVGLAFWLLVGGQLPIYLRGFVGYPMLALGIYLMHAFCWIMGWVYQRHHVEFPWVLQRHVRSQDDEVTR